MSFVNTSILRAQRALVFYRVLKGFLSCLGGQGACLRPNLCMSMTTFRLISQEVLGVQGSFFTDGVFLGPIDCIKFSERSAAYFTKFSANLFVPI